MLNVCHLKHDAGGGWKRQNEVNNSIQLSKRQLHASNFAVAVWSTLELPFNDDVSFQFVGCCWDGTMICVNCIWAFFYYSSIKNYQNTKNFQKIVQATSIFFNYKHIFFNFLISSHRMPFERRFKLYKNFFHACHSIELSNTLCTSSLTSAQPQEGLNFRTLSTNSKISNFHQILPNFQFNVEQRYTLYHDGMFNEKKLLRSGEIIHLH